jgi:DNA-binding NtrC family response regulator
LKKRHPEIMVVYMSGYASEAFARQGALESGMRFIQKPFLPSDLTSSIRAFLDDANAAGMT